MKDIMRRFARYEITYEDIPKELFDNDEIGLIYQITLDDLLSVIRKLEKDNIPGYAFADEWLSGTYEWEIEEALGLDDLIDDEEAIGGHLAILPNNEQDLFRIIYYKLDSPILLDGNEDSAAAILETDQIHKLIEDCECNKNKPMTEWEFPDFIKQGYVMELDAMIHEKLHYSDDQKSLFVRYLHELADKGNRDAREILGYQYYGGTKAFACDWVKARDIFEELFDETGDPRYANTLGYIYYYGRCNGGVPEDEKAYRCFSYGSAAGIYESSYKLADMIKQGRSVPKNRNVAQDIIERLYFQNRRLFEAGQYECNFADVALRLGGFDEDRLPNSDGTLGDMIDPLGAFAYYLQAELAIKLRAKNGYHYGDDVVAHNINKALDRMRSIIEVSEDDHFVEEEPYLIMNIAGNYNYLNVAFKNVGDDVKASFRRCDENNMLLTLPEFGYCDLVESIDIYAMKVSNELSIDDEKEYLLTDIAPDFDGGIEFYSGDDLIAAIKCEAWSYRIPHKDKRRSSAEI